MRNARALWAAIAVAFAIGMLAGCTTTPNTGGISPGASADAGPKRPVKVLIITMFKPEADAWTKEMPFTDEIRLPGLSPDFPAVKCTAADVCILTTGMGHTNAAASTMALVMSNRFDLSQTYFLVTGISGIDPNVGTIGSAAWARYLVDYGIAHEIDAREMPATWQAGYFGIHAANPETSTTAPRSSSSTSGFCRKP